MQYILFNPVLGLTVCLWKSIVFACINRNFEPEFGYLKIKVICRQVLENLNKKLLINLISKMISYKVCMFAIFCYSKHLFNIFSLINNSCLYMYLHNCIYHSNQTFYSTPRSIRIVLVYIQLICVLKFRLLDDFSI